MVRLKDIKEASDRLKDVIHETPLVYSYAMSELTGANVYFKLENLQRTGSFKIRGSYNKLSQLKGKTKSVVAASAGNHAQGVSLSSNLLGMKSKVFMPEGTPINKMLGVKNYGSEVELMGENFDESLRYALSESRKSGSAFIHAFNDEEIIAGQGTIGLEIANNLNNVDAVFVPIGGGGLISGVSTAIKELQPRARIYGVQSANVPSMLEAIKKNRPVEVKSTGTLADGIAVRKVGGITLKIVKKLVDDVFTVSEDEIEEALLILASKKRLVVEGCGGVGLAGLIKKQKKFKNKNVVVIISGGNIDINILAKIIDRGMARTGRIMKLELELPDIPGALGILSTLLGEIKANIIHILHDRMSEGLAINRAIVEISMETRSFQHQKDIIKVLKRNKYNILKVS
ncbi:MAG: threonine ammonia-lyase [Thermodesulfobacteriota bacterium]